MLHVMFSYTRTYTTAKNLAETLTSDFKAAWKESRVLGEPILYDWEVTPAQAGDELETTLREQIEHSNVFVAIIDEYYAEKIAGWELGTFVKKKGKWRLIPILLGRTADKVWKSFEDSIKASLGGDVNIVYYDLRDGFDNDNQLKVKQRSDLIEICKAAVKFVLDEVSPPPAGKQPGVVVMGEPLHTDFADAREAREALTKELSSKVPEKAMVDLGDGWDLEESQTNTMARLRSQKDATDICLVSVRSGRRVEKLISKEGADETRAVLKGRLDSVVGRLGASKRKPKSVVWVVGNQPQLGELDGVHFVNGDAKAVSHHVLSAVGVTGDCPFLVEDIGKNDVSSWLQFEMPPLLFEPPETAPVSYLMTDEKNILETLRGHPDDKRSILAISDKGAPPLARLEAGSGAQELQHHILQRIKQFEILIERAGPSRRANTLCLVIQICGHMHPIGQVYALSTEKRWYTLRVHPDRLSLLDDPAVHKDRIRRFMAGLTV